MREILFRGKRIDNGEWVEGMLTVDPTICEYVIDMIGAHSIIVYNGTIGQYTGLTDKNGKRIFEGDIVECWSEGVCARGTVQQRKDGLWIIYPAWQKHIMWGLCPDEHSNTSVEVIGNNHDNSELVKEE